MQQVLYNVLSAYFLTVPLGELVDTKDRTKRQKQSIYLVINGAACSSCMSKGERLERSGIRASALEDREATVQAILWFVTQIPIQRQASALSPTKEVESILNEMKRVLIRIMCPHDLEKVAIALIELVGCFGKSFRFRELASNRSSNVVTPLQQKAASLQQSGLVTGWFSVLLATFLT